MPKYILSHDLGTSGNKASLYDIDGYLINSTVYSYELFTGDNNGAEQNADDWWRAVCETSKSLTQNINNKDIIAISFSGQMMGCLCVDKNGEPLFKSLIWADMRSNKQEVALRQKIDDAKFYHLTGHRLSSSYSITKLMWIKDNYPTVYKNTYKMLNAKDYIILKLTGKFVTDYSDASATCLMDLKKLEWSKELFAISGLDIDKMPDILPSTQVVGGITKEAAEYTGLAEGTAVVCGGGDGCCAAVGTGVIKEGNANCCLGTSSWISIASKEPICDEKMTNFNFAHMVPGLILPCGTMQTGGGSLSWAVNNLFGELPGCEKPPKNAIYDTVGKEVAASPIGAKGLLFLPYLIGERSPRWNPNAKGTFIGLTLNHNRGDMLRSVMEGVGYNLEIILNTFRQSSAVIDELTMIGGGARNMIWQQIISDICGIKVKIPNYLEEATSMGAAVTAGVGVGEFSDFEAVYKFIKIERENAPNTKNTQEYQNNKELFEQAYQALVPVFKKM